MVLYFVLGITRSLLPSCFVACSFAILQLPEMVSKWKWKYLFVARLNTYEFAKISFYIYLSFYCSLRFFSTLKSRLRSLFLSILNFVSLVLAVFLAVTQLVSCDLKNQARALCSAQRYIWQRRSTRIGSFASPKCSNSESNRCVYPKGSWFVDPDVRPRAYILSGSFTIVAVT